MKITRTAEIRSQIELVNSSKAELLRMITERIESAKRLRKSTSELQDLYEELDAVSEHFDISANKKPYAKVNRYSNMLSGPFFVSEKYPVPVVGSKEMYPLIQLDLGDLSKALDAAIGAGLLQLWYDVSGEREFIRIIPTDELNDEELIAYQVDPLNPDDAFPLPIWMELDPVANGVNVVNEFISRGIQNKGEFVDCYFRLFENKDDLLRRSLMNFEKIGHQESGGSFAVGGTLQAIQYNHTDVKMRQLLKFTAWGSSGNAEIFFRSRNDQATEYLFRSCVR